VTAVILQAMLATGEGAPTGSEGIAKRINFH
jgi:hypothetical protein